MDKDNTAEYKELVKKLRLSREMQAELFDISFHTIVRWTKPPTSKSSSVVPVEVLNTLRLLVAAGVVFEKTRRSRNHVDPAADVILSDHQIRRIHALIDAVPDIEKKLPPLPSPMTVSLPAGRFGRWLVAVDPAGTVDAQAYNVPDGSVSWHEEIEHFTIVAAKLAAAKAV